MTANLIKFRTSIKARITQIQNYIYQTYKEEDGVESLTARLEKLDELYNKYENIQSEIEDADPSGDYEDERLRIDDQCLMIKTKIMQLQNMHTRRENMSTNIPEVRRESDAEHSVTNQVKLPQLHIPIFEGKYEQWRSFYDMFNTIINDNRTISNIEKLIYLRSSLRGEAFKIIEALSSTNENYDIALQLLKERYDNQNYIVNAHIKALFEIPLVSKDNINGLRTITSETKQHLRSLKAFNLNVDSWDPIIIYMITEKLDMSTRTAWQLYKPDNKLATLEELFKFLDHRCSSLEHIQRHRQEGKPNSNFKRNSSYVAANSITNSANKYVPPVCKLCKNNHYLYHCNDFLKLSTNERVKLIQTHKYCFNCLKPNHNANDCKSGKCTKCGKKHNTLIHFEKPENIIHESSKIQIPSTSEESLHRGSYHNAAGPKEIILATVLLQIQDTNGKWHSARALLDSGSQCNFVTEKLITKLQLNSQSVHVNLSGIQNKKTEINKSSLLSIRSRIYNYKTSLEFLVMKEITCNLPHTHINFESWNMPTHIDLADPNFNVPGPIDLLIGAEVYFDILRNEQLSLGKQLPFIINTHFGWIISGKLNQKLAKTTQNARTTLFAGFTADLNNKLERFWKIEEVGIKQIMTREEKECEQLFQDTTKRDKNGRYIVELPLKNNINQLGDSYELAKRRFMSLHVKLQNNEELNQMYREFMSQYLKLNHMEKITEKSETSTTKYYIPHHAIFKESSSSTKLRVVFDASMKTSTRISLNDVMKVGPTIHEDIMSIVLRFRIYKFVITADIEKMYRQINVTQEHTDLQRILWYEEDSNNLQIYRLKTVTYGTASAPYLATKTLQQLAMDEGDSFPLAKPVLLNDFYVDDVMTGSNEVAEVLQIQQELINLLARGNFNLHKWCTNSKEVLNKIEPDKREKKTSVFMDKEAVKTLGLLWLPVEDKLGFVMNTKNINAANTTKRTILSEIASIYDPLGLLSPLVVKAKLFIQRLWKEHVDWDEQLDREIVSEWVQFQTKLKELTTFEIDRRVSNLDSPKLTYELHGFCDASQIAYGACIYIKCIDEYGNTSVQLICAKSRIAPIKPITVPRLELCGALTLARLQQRTAESLKLPISTTNLWTDSSIVLHWIASNASRWKIFVGNRVNEIQELTHNCTWRHVSTNDNPADHLSRGLNAVEIQQSQTWWQGPPWLKNSISTWPHNNLNEFNKEDLEEQTIISVNTVIMNFDIFNKFSSLLKLKRVFAYCMRFINNLRRHRENQTKNLSATELKTSLHVLIKCAQQEIFHKEIELLQNNKPLINSKLKNLNPFIDSDNLLRVGGRLENFNVEYDKKHPLILPDNHKLTQLIIQHDHLKLFHAGTQAVLGSLREKYWPIRARNTIRKLIHNCITCFRLKAQQSNQLMGNLPTYRGKISKPFTNTGVDYGGPFLIKQSSRKNSPTIKAYLALFVCLSTRAIHLELVSDLSAQAFLSALRRFIARRGACHTILSDNATNFKGAKHELHDLYILFNQQYFKQEIINASANQEIIWKFIPPGAPHFGGIWEAGIKTVKHHLRRVVGLTHYTFEQFYTLITQIESCVNSRPLYPMSDDPSDYSYLTPGHFLMGSSPVSVPEPQLQDIVSNRLSAYQLIQKQVQTFWKIWSRDYLNTLQQRTKWSNINPNIKVGAVVLLREDNLPASNWILGRIAAIHPGADNLVRVVSVKTIKGIYKRPVTKVCLLPIADNFESDLSRGAKCLVQSVSGCYGT